MIPLIPIFPGQPSVMNFKELCPCVPKNSVQILECTRFYEVIKIKHLLTMCTSTVSVIVKTHLQGVHCAALFTIMSQDQSFIQNHSSSNFRNDSRVSSGERQKTWRSSTAISWPLTGRIRRGRERCVD